MTRTIHSAGGSSLYVLEQLNDETPEQRRNAALTVCERAGNAKDAKPLLQALGLVSYDGKAGHWHHGGPSGGRDVVREGSL